MTTPLEIGNLDELFKKLDEIKDLIQKVENALEGVFNEFIDKKLYIRPKDILEMSEYMSRVNEFLATTTRKYVDALNILRNIKTIVGAIAGGFLVQSFLNILFSPFAEEFEPQRILEGLMSLMLLFRFLLVIEPIIPETEVVVGNIPIEIGKVLPKITMRELNERFEKFLLIIPRLIELDYMPTELQKLFGFTFEERIIRTHVDFGVEFVSFDENIENSLLNVAGIITYFWSKEYILEVIRKAAMLLFDVYREFALSLPITVLASLYHVDPDLYRTTVARMRREGINKDLLFSNILFVFRVGNTYNVEHTFYYPTRRDQPPIRAVIRERIINELNKIKSSPIITSLGIDIDERKVFPPTEYRFGEHPVKIWNIKKAFGEAYEEVVRVYGEPIPIMAIEIEFVKYLSEKIKKRAVEIIKSSLL